MNLTLRTKTALTLLALASSLLPTQAAWVTWEIAAGGNGHQYQVIGPTAGLSWNTANHLATAQGDYLATITSAAENAFVFNLVNNSAYFSSFNGSGPALGGYNAGTPTAPDWRWVTGEAWTYQNWGAGLPDYGDFGAGPEDRLHFFSGNSGIPSAQWNDLQQDDQNLGGFVIEHVVPEPTSTALVALALAATACRRTKRCML